jgi:purine-binding chemotaxis protein CheW
MTNRSFLTFILQGKLLAVDTEIVREIIWLPELTLVEECPSYIAGLINMRGKLVPVMDLTVRFGHGRERFRCSDRVIVLSRDLRNEMVGIIANDVLEVVEISEESIEPSSHEKGGQNGQPYFISGKAKAGEDIIMILDPRTIFDTEFGIKETESEKPEIHPDGSAVFCPEADRGERDLFHKRAITLQRVFNDDAIQLIPVAVIRLKNESVFLELEAVREFTGINNFTPVPCCPAHIAGNMNLRGNVLTVLDIAGMLNLKTSGAGGTVKVVVADSGEFLVGVMVDEILDVTYLRASDIVPVSSSIKARNEKFVKGAAPYEGKMMALLDLKEILSWDGLIVNEEVN